jgi:hypothetical protein
MIDRMQITFINVGLKEVDRGVITLTEYKALKLMILGKDKCKGQKPRKVLVSESFDRESDAFYPESKSSFSNDAESNFIL